MLISTEGSDNAHHETKDRLFGLGSRGRRKKDEWRNLERPKSPKIKGKGRMNLVLLYSFNIYNAHLNFERAVLKYNITVTYLT